MRAPSFGTLLTERVLEPLGLEHTDCAGRIRPRGTGSGVPGSRSPSRVCRRRARCAPARGTCSPISPRTWIPRTRTPRGPRAPAGGRPGGHASALRQALAQVSRPLLRHPHSDDRLGLVWNIRQRPGHRLVYHAVRRLASSPSPASVRRPTSPSSPSRTPPGPGALPSCRTPISRCANWRAVPSDRRGRAVPPGHRFRGRRSAGMPARSLTRGPAAAAPGCDAACPGPRVRPRAAVRPADGRGDGARHRGRELAGGHAVAAVDRQAGQQRDRQPGLDVLQRQHVVAEPAHHPRLEPGLRGTAGWPGSPCTTAACRTPTARRRRPPGPRRRARPRGGPAGTTSTIGSVGQRHEVEVRAQRQLDEVGGRDDDVHVAGRAARACSRAAPARSSSTSRCGCARPAGSPPARPGCGSRSGRRRAGPARPARRPGRAAPPRRVSMWSRIARARRARISPAGVSRTRRPVRSSSCGARLGLQHGELLRHARRAQVGGLRDRAHGAQGVEPAQQPQPPRVQHAAIVVRLSRTAQPEL